MRQFLYKTVLLVLLISCNSPSDKNVVQKSIDSLRIPNDSATIYFPFPEYSESQVKENKRSLDSFVFAWYSKMLFSMHEPVLYSYRGENEIYRFTLLRSFDHPISVRLQKAGDSIKLFSKVTSGAGGYEPGQIIWDTMFNIRPTQMDTLNSLVNKADFWNIPTEVNDGGLDGAEWILEAVDKNKYHWISRWSPSADRHLSFKTVCDYLLNISKAPVISNRIY
jgi:hypothetical protein